MRKSIIPFIKERCGAVAIEFALVLPLYVLLMTSMYELTMFALLENKMQRLVSVMADTISRQDVSATTIQGLLSQSAQFTVPFSFAPGNITVSQIQNNGSTALPANMLISWQQSFQGSASRLGVAGTRPTNMPNNFQVLNNQTVIVAEATYVYTSFVFASIIGNRTVYSIYMTTPRQGTMNSLLVN